MELLSWGHLFPADLPRALLTVLQQLQNRLATVSAMSKTLTLPQPEQRKTTAQVLPFHAFPKRKDFNIVQHNQK